jgi:hypothetical protein
MTYEEFLEKKPSSGWIEISDARLNLLSAIHESNRFTGTIKKVYIPVGSAAPEAAPSDDKIHLLLLTQDQAILKTMKDLEAATGGGGGLAGRLKRRLDAAKAKRSGESKEPVPAAEAEVEKAFGFVVDNRDKIVISRPVRGLLQFGHDSKSSDRRKIQALDPNIAPDFAVLEDGTQPQLGASVLMLVAGLGAAGLLVSRIAKAGRSGPSPPGESAPPAGPESPSPATPSVWESEPDPGAGR